MTEEALPGAFPDGPAVESIDSGPNQAVEHTIVALERRLNEQPWGTEPFALGTVCISGTGQGLGAVTLERVMGLPEELINDPDAVSGEMVQELVADIIKNEGEMAWLQNFVANTGFIGMFMVREGTGTNESGVTSVRQALFYSQTQGLLTVQRVRGESESKTIWLPLSALLQREYFGYLAFVHMTEAMQYARLRWELRGIGCGSGVS